MAIFLILCTAVVISIFWPLLNKHRQQPAESHLGRSPPALPILGHLFQIPRQHPWLVFTEWAKVYGNIIPLKVFGRRLLVLSSIDDVHELFENRSSIYSERAPRQMAYLCGFRDALIFKMYDKDTRKARRLLHAELNKHAIQRKGQLCEREVVRFIRRLVSPLPDIGFEGRLLSASVILMIAYGYQPISKNDAVVSVSLQVMRFLEKVITPNAYLVDALPFLRFVPPWFPGARFQVEAQRCRKLVDEMVTTPYNDSLRRMSQGDMYPCLISKNAEKCEEKGDSKLLMWTAAQLFGAGSHTSTSTIKFFFLAMVLYPEVQAKLQKEVDDVVGDSRLPKLSDREAMPYSECVLKEVYRWRPVAPLVAHSCRTDDQYKGLDIRAGTVVMANIWALAHDEDVYPDSHHFIPERFLSPRVQDPRDFVFGFGRRICPGIHLAEDVLWMMMATAAATLNISPEVDDNGNEALPDDRYTSGAVIEPHPFMCKIEARSNSALDLLYGEGSA